MRLRARNLAVPAAVLLALAGLPDPARAQNVGTTSTTTEPEQPQPGQPAQEGQPAAKAPAGPRDLWKGRNYLLVQGQFQLRTVGMPQSTFSGTGGGTWPAYDLKATNLGLRMEGNGLAVEIGRAGLKTSLPGSQEKGLLMLAVAGNFGGMVSYQFPGTVIHVGLVWPEILVRESTDFGDTFILTGALALPAARFSAGPAVLDVRFGELALDLEMEKFPALAGTSSSLQTRLGLSFVPAFEVRLGGWF